MINTARRKYEKAEDFVGWKSDDGKLEVIGIYGKQGTQTTFKVTCTECSKDPELFPLGYFVSIKGNLLKGQLPCGCGKGVKYSVEQFMIRVNRAVDGKNFIVHGISGKYNGNKTKLECECLIDGQRWTPNINCLLRGYGCPKCKTKTLKLKNLTPAHDVINVCKSLCLDSNYIFIGFTEGYSGVKSKFKYICHTHGEQSMSYDNFFRGRRCKSCWKDKQKEMVSGFYGYYPERKDEQDYLYILNFNDKFIKVGRSFDVDERIKGLKRPCESGIKKVYKLRIFTATHQEIYDLEQKLHNELRERNFQHYVDWSTECFENNCQFILNKLLDNCGLDEVL